MTAPVALHRVLFAHHEKQTLVRVGAVFAKTGLASLGLTLVTVVVLIFGVVVGDTAGFVAGGLVLVFYTLGWVVLPLVLLRDRRPCEAHRLAAPRSRSAPTRRPGSTTGTRTRRPGRRATWSARWSTARPTSPSCSRLIDAAEPATWCCSPTGAATPTSSCWTSPAPRSATCSAAPAERGVDVTRPDLALAPRPARASASEENRHLGEEIDDAGGECAARHAGAPGRLAPPEVRRPPPPGPARSATSPSSAASTCATAAATTPSTAATRRRSRWPPVYGETPPWHDVQLADPRAGRRTTSRPSSASGGRTRRR